MAGAVTTAHATDFRSHASGIGAGDPAWLSRMRGEALERFERLGFPSPRAEAWKHTNIAPIAATTFAPAGTWRKVGAEPHLPDGRRLVFLNGRFEESLSDPGPPTYGLLAGSLHAPDDRFPGLVEEYLGRDATLDEHAFTALNTALMGDGAVIVVPDGSEVEEPVHLVFLAEPAAEPVACHPRILIVCGRNAGLTVTETYAAVGEGGPYLTNSVAEMHLADGARLDHYRIQREDPSAYHIGRLTARQARDSRLSTTGLALGAALARIDLEISLEGEGAEAELHGLYLTDGERHADQHTDVRHKVPGCTSNERFKGILAGRSSAVFDGRIHVLPHAVRTDARQSNQNLLLSDDATIHTRPRLEIHADDVRCTHGATIGKLDDNALFYLRSRGIGEADARNLLVSAFAGDILDRIRLPELRESLKAEIASRIRGERDAELPR